jgi:hypothetical protein
MNIFLIFTMLAIFLIPLWILFGRSSSNKSIPESRPDHSPITDEPFPEDTETEYQDRNKKENRLDDITKIDSDFDLPYDSTRIIPEESPFSIYKGTLDNAEYYTNNGDFSTALDLYEGLNQRISNPEIREKINENIDYLNNYQQIAATREKEKRFRDADSDENEIKLSLGGKDYSPQNIKIDITPTSMNADFNMDTVIDTISEQISRLNPALQESSEKIEEIIQYKNELQQLKGELKSLHDLKEESHRVREERLRHEIEEIKSIKEGLSKAPLPEKQSNEIELLKQEIRSLRDDQRKALSAASNSFAPVANHNDLSAETSDSASVVPEATTDEGQKIEVTKLPEPADQNVKITEMPEHNELEALKLKVDSVSNELTIKNNPQSMPEIPVTESAASSIESQKAMKAHELELLELRSKVARLESEQFSATSESSSRENEQLRSQIEDMQQQMEELRSHSDESAALHELKDRISRFENQSLSKSLDREQMERIVKEVEQLAQNARLSDDVERKIETLIKNQLSASTDQLSHQKLEDITSQLGELKNELAGSQQTKPAFPTESAGSSSPTPPSSTDTNQTSDPADSHQPEDSTEEAKPAISSGSSVDFSKKTSGEDSTADSVTTQDTNLQLSADEKEDAKKDDFETLEEYINGPKYDEPSEDEILEKILADSAKNEEKEYEIRGTDNSKDFSDDFDLSKLFAKPSAIDSRDEEFYNQFTERNKHRVKKELPILHVSYKFDKLPEISSLSKESNVIANTFYKYKTLLEKANEYIKRRRVKDALNYYQVVMDQDIPDEFKIMLQQNIDDLKEYLEKYMLNM